MNPNDTPEIQAMLKRLREMEAAMNPNPAMRKLGRYAHTTNLGDIAAMLRQQIRDAGGVIPERFGPNWC